jgi:Tfp pilus assembly protein PilN
VVGRATRYRIVIRANLLPRRRETINAFSFELELDLLREIGLALAIVLVVAMIGIEIERVRVDRLTDAATQLEARVAANAPQREESRQLMLDVARYQEFEREASAYRRSGTLAATAVATIGNAVPEHVWVDEITRADNGYTIAGGSRSVDSLAGAIASLGRARPNDRASLVNISNRERDGAGVHFTARLAPIAAASAQPLPAAPHALAASVGATQ